MIKESSINAVKSAMEITDVVSDHLKLTKKGAELVACCPFHNEKTGSFKVSKSKQIYKCFGCGVSGDAIDFVMRIKNLSYMESLQLIADKYRIDLEEERHEKKTYTRPSKPVLPLTDKQITFFNQRGISAATLMYAKVTNDRTWMPKAGTDTDAICFNYYVNEEIVNIKYRGENKDFKLFKGGELVFYNLDSIKGKDYCIIVEGEIDCLTVMECGINTVISVPNGANINGGKLEYLDNCYELIKHINQFILFADNDDAGNKLRDELARRLGYEKCLKVVYPADCKDANDIYLKYGKKAVLQCLSEAIEFPIEGIISVSDVIEDVAEYYMNGYPQGKKAGIPNFDDLISFMPGQFTTITGIPGSGKSEMTDYITTQLAVIHKWSGAYCSFENQPTALHVTKVMEKIVGKSFAFRYDSNSRISQDEFDKCVPFINDYFHFVNINEADVSIDGILAKIEELVRRKGIKMAVIDPWNYIEHKIKIGQTETQYTSESLTKIKSACLKLGIHIFLVAHPTKMRKVTDANGGEKYEVPNLYSISGSAHFFNKTDNGICVYRDFKTGQVDVYIQKVRYSWLGKIGFCSFTYNTETRQYQPVNT